MSVYNLQHVIFNQSSNTSTSSGRRAFTVTEMLTSALHVTRIDVHSEQLGQLKTFYPQVFYHLSLQEVTDLRALLLFHLLHAKDFPGSLNHF